MKKNAFMIMPFSDEAANEAYKHCIKPVCDEFNLNIRRSDEIFSTNPVYDDIITEIQNASVIIADLSGRNPNVFYELGISHNLKQNQTIMVTHDEFTDSPFDISHFRILHYIDSIQGGDRFKQELRNTLKNVLRDYKTIYRSEFELVYEVMETTKKQGEFIIIIGIEKYSKIIRVTDSVRAEGHINEISTSHMSRSIKDAMSPFIIRGYVKIENDLIRLSDVGKAFVEFLEKKGYVCDSFNDQIFTKGFVPLMRRKKEKPAK